MSVNSVLSEPLASIALEAIYTFGAVMGPSFEKGLYISISSVFIKP